jgi:hypothetical protein
MTEAANAPQHLTEEQFEAIASRVSKPLLKLKNYARQQAGRFQKPPKTINKPGGSRDPSYRMLHIYKDMVHMPSEHGLCRRPLVQIKPPQPGTVLPQ